jgi:flagellin-specific chaperone FliS
MSAIYASELISRMNDIVNELNSLNEDSFDEKFPGIKQKMVEVHEIQERTFYLYSDADQKKVSDASKLIKETFDNVLRKWMDRVEEVKKELDLQLNQKKILSYKRF